MADRRNRELHSGAAAFEGHDASTWLPQTYEVIEVLLNFLDDDFTGLFGSEQAGVAQAMLKDRRGQTRSEVQSKIAQARRAFDILAEDSKGIRVAKGRESLDAWVTKSALRQIVKCPSCSFDAALAGESQSRGPVQINEAEGTITREVRVLPHALRCPTCGLKLDGYQELLEAKLGQVFTTTEEEDPIEFFGIVPEEHVDIDDLLRRYHEAEYDNE
jgi:hypothetical protein